MNSKTHTRKTLLYKLFRIGRVPARVRSSIEVEQILLIDEGISGSVTFKNYKAPGKRLLLRRVWFTGSLIVTRVRTVAFAYSREIINLTNGDPNRTKILIDMQDSVLCIALNAHDFHPEQSGRIEFRFRTAKAEEFARHLMGTA